MSSFYAFREKSEAEAKESNKKSEAASTGQLTDSRHLSSADIQVIYSIIKLAKEYEDYMRL
jgi:hypothetical protein